MNPGSRDALQCWGAAFAASHCCSAQGDSAGDTARGTAPCSTRGSWGDVTALVCCPGSWHWGTAQCLCPALSLLSSGCVVGPGGRLACPPWQFLQKLWKNACPSLGESLLVFPRLWRGLDSSPVGAALSGAKREGLRGASAQMQGARAVHKCSGWEKPAQLDPAVSSCLL